MHWPHRGYPEKETADRAGEEAKAESGYTPCNQGPAMQAALQYP